MKAARLLTTVSGLSRTRIARKVEEIIAMSGAAWWGPPTAILTAFVLLLLTGLMVETLIVPGLYRTSLAIAVMTLLVLISTGFRATNLTGSWVFWSCVAFFLTLIILWPVTYEVMDRGSVMAYIIFLVFCIACFDFEIEVYERERREMK